MCITWITPDLQLERRPGENVYVHVLCEGDVYMCVSLCVLKVNCKVYEANLLAFITFWPCVSVHMCTCMFVCM